VRRVATLFVLAAVVGCSAGPQVRYYTLAPQPSPLDATTGPRLGVLPFAVEAPYNGTRLVYRATPDTPRVGFYAFHQWAAPVGHQVAAVVAEELGGRVPGHVVEVASSGREYAGLVHGRVLQLEEVDTEQAVESRVTLEIELRSPGGEVWRVERVESRQQQGATASVDDVVRLMQQSLAEAVDRALPGLVSTLSERSSGGPR
jgi:uncharacterized lipoprotein YmbA